MDLGEIMCECEKNSCGPVQAPVAGSYKHGNKLWDSIKGRLYLEKLNDYFFSTGFYSPYRTLAFLNRLLDPQTFGRTPWLGDQSNTRPLPTHRTTQHRNT
jgi:hypothetical protein